MSNPDDDTSEAPPSRAFVDGPFGVKFMHGADKRDLFEAAKRAKLAQGEWLGAAIREKVAREREMTAQGYALITVAEPGVPAVLTAREPAPPAVQTLTPRPRGDGRDEALLSINDIGLAIEVAERIARLRKRDYPPARMLAAAQRMLMMRLTEG